jgi:hypothetical protein
MQKLEKDGKIAVLVSHGFGAGWSTWNHEYQDILCMDSEIVQAVLDKDIKKAEELAKQKCPDCYTGGVDGLEVHWVKKGQAFEIEEYDGSESLHIIGNRSYMVA